ncbi:hypothetical protein D3C85_1104090 [compost metagenome]
MFCFRSFSTFKISILFCNAFNFGCVSKLKSFCSKSFVFSVSCKVISSAVSGTSSSEISNGILFSSHIKLDNSSFALESFNLESSRLNALFLTIIPASILSMAGLSPWTIRDLIPSRRISAFLL